jgi:4-alpha-glucanotransferase
MINKDIHQETYLNRLQGNSSVDCCQYSQFQQAKIQPLYPIHEKLKRQTRKKKNELIETEIYCIFQNLHFVGDKEKIQKHSVILTDLISNNCN